MKLIALVVVLFIERLWDQVARWRAQRFAERGFMRLYRELRGALGASVTRWLILIPAPVILWWGVGFDSSGVIGLLVGLIVLFVILAPRHAHEAAAELRKACAEEAPERAAQLRTGLLEQSRIDPSTANRRVMAERIVVLGFDEWFAVLFWFVIAGPGGALLYRLADWLVQAEAQAKADVDEGPDDAVEYATDDDSANVDLVIEAVEDGQHPPTALEYIRAVLGWPAARVYAALLLVVGAFNRGLSAWVDDESAGRLQGARSHIEAGSLGLIARVGHAALDLEQDDRCEDDEVCLADQAGWYKSASAIVLRVLMAWLGVVALVTFAGWIN
jgi:AmpE protein